MQLMKRSLHIIKIKNKTLALIAAAGLLTGFSGFGITPLSAKTAGISEIRKDLNDGDLYQARKKTQKILEKKPDDVEAQKLMADIIDHEIARHKEIMTGSAKEEIPVDEKEEEIKTWLERAKSLMDLKRYNEAVLAVEKAFSYDAENKKASKLMDEIRIHALKDGQQEVLVRQQIARSEITERVANYVGQAESYIHEGSWGAARMTVDKILLLQPENKQAVKLQKKIVSHNEKEIRSAKTGLSESRERSETKEFGGAKTGATSIARSGEPAGPTEAR